MIHPNGRVRTRPACRPIAPTSKCLAACGGVAGALPPLVDSTFGVRAGTLPPLAPLASTALPRVGTLPPSWEDLDVRVKTYVHRSEPARLSHVDALDAGRWDRTSRHKGLIIDPIDSDAIQHQPRLIKEQDIVRELNPWPQTVHVTDLGIGDNDMCTEVCGHPIVALVLSCDKAVEHDGFHEDWTNERVKIVQLVELSHADWYSQPVNSDPRVNMSKGCTNRMQMGNIGIRRVLPHAELNALRWVMSTADNQLISCNSKLRRKVSNKDPAAGVHTELKLLNRLSELFDDIK